MAPAAGAQIEQLEEDLDGGGGGGGDAHMEHGGGGQNADQIGQRDAHSEGGKQRVEHGKGGFSTAIEKAVANINTVLFISLPILIFEEPLGKIRCRQQAPEPQQKAIRRDFQQWPKA